MFRSLTDIARCVMGATCRHLAQRQRGAAPAREI
jgi:hypothetical protein